MSLLRLITFRKQPEPAGPLWTPAEISTGLWLDASDNSTITLNGSNVSQWDDKSGNSRNATQSTAANQPAYLTADQNGLNVIDCDLDWFSYSNLSTVSTFSSSTFVVMQATGLGSTNYPPIVTWFNNGGLYHYLGGSGTNWGVYDGGFRFSTESIGNNWKIVENIRDKSTAQNIFYSTGNSVGSTGLTSAGYTSKIGNDDANQRSRMKIGEIVITLDVVSTINRQKIEGYLAHKWGLTANLPAGHPYKTTPPYV